MESRFGRDFSDVRVHRDASAAATARALAARAYTLGQHIVFAQQEYRPGTASGRHLLAHELTHVIQQSGGTARGLQRVAAAPVQIQRADRVVPYQALSPGEVGPPTPLTGNFCAATTGDGAARASAFAIGVHYDKDAPRRGNRAELSLRDRDDGDRALHTAAIPATSNSGNVSIPSGISIAEEDHHYELELIYFNSRGTRFGGLGRGRPVIRFQVCELNPEPSGDDLLFARALYAEGVDAGEFPYVRDLVYNRIAWVSLCPADLASFGSDVRTVLEAPDQFASVLGPTQKFLDFVAEFRTHAGPCRYTTPPRTARPATCRLINAAIAAEAAGNGNTHDYFFFRSDTQNPRAGRAISRWRYPGGNYYWEIRGCPTNGIVVGTDALTVRERPDTGSRRVFSYPRGNNATLLCVVEGTPVDDDPHWYGTDRGGFVAARYVRVTGTAPLPCDRVNFSTPGAQTP